MLHKLARDGIQAHLLLNAAQIEGNLGHAIDHAALLILADGVRAALAHAEQSARAVLAHAGEQYPHRAVAAGFGHRFKQHVHGGTMAADLLAFGHFHLEPVAHAAHLHMLVAGGDQDAAAPKSLRFRLLSH